MTPADWFLFNPWYTALRASEWLLCTAAATLATMSVLAIVRKRWRSTMHQVIQPACWILLGAGLVTFSLSTTVYRPLLQNPYARHVYLHRNWFWLAQLALELIPPQMLWLRACRSRPWMTFSIAALTLLPTGYERLVLILTSASQDFLPASWSH